MLRSRHPYLHALLLLAILAAPAAQARQAGEPRGWSLAGSKHAAAAVPLVELAPIDPAALLAEDASGAAPTKGGSVLRFAVPRELALRPATDGRWLTLADGGRLWQARVRVPNATDLNFALSRFVLPDGATLHLYSTAERYYEGPYTAADVKPHGKFWSPVVPGSEAVIELYLPAGAPEAELAVAAVYAGYRDLFGRDGGPVLKQGSCNIDVVCPLGDLYRDEIRSVARYSIGGSGLCTGTLMMDAAATFRPWFLTAAHCGIDTEADADSLVFYWNFESASCGELSGGSLADNQAGAAFRAWRADVDMSLVELDAQPDGAFGVHYAGWDRSGSAPMGSIHIHHPRGDEKAISFNDDPLTTGNSCIGSGGVTSHWIIDNYEQGTTEPGSSGSGVWTQAPAARLIGFLSGGGASCSEPTLGDCYGKLSVAWDGSAGDERLRDWLGGGLVTPPVTVDGADRPDFGITLDPPSLALCRSDTADVDVQVTTTGGFSESVTLSLDGAPPGVSGSFTPNPVSPPASAVLDVDVGPSVSTGDHLLLVEGSSASRDAGRTLPLRVDSSPPATPALSTPSVSAVNVELLPAFAWAAVTGASAYRLEVAVGFDFANPLIDVQVADTGYIHPVALAPSTTYRWRVSAINGCGTGTASASRSFTTGSAWCRTETVAIPDADPIGVSREMVISDLRVLQDLDLAVEIAHGYVGDVSVLLRHEDSGTEIHAIDRPGVPASTFGCDKADIDALLDDEAAAAVESRCNGNPAISGSFRPNEALSAFDGEALGGTWTLRVTDSASPDPGSLLRWCLMPTLAAVADTAVFRDGFE